MRLPEIQLISFWILILNNQDDNRYLYHYVISTQKVTENAKYNVIFVLFCLNDKVSFLNRDKTQRIGFLFI